ncbi:MAG: DUF1836 domain-containing protein [Sphaerochaetaceae bacterium]|nr:DUF1836 domain-containing protein [Sphaerochaetaceae bacterium]
MNDTAIDMQNFTLPEYEMIPDVGLFLEQVVRYISPLMESLGEEGLTGSMISNYVKKKIIENPVKKQYYREQIATLIFIAVAKTVLSLDDIQLMLSLQAESYPTKDAYEYFRKELSSILKSVFSGEEMKTDNDMNEKKTLLRNMIIAVGHKVYLDTYLRSLR